jgi:hypothetical protein
MTSTADEITPAWEILRTRQALDGRIRVVSITLRAGSHAG